MTREDDPTTADALVWLGLFADFLRREAPHGLGDKEWFCPMIGGTALRDFLEFTDKVKSGEWAIIDRESREQALAKAKSAGQSQMSSMRASFDGDRVGEDRADAHEVASMKEARKLLGLESPIPPKESK